MTPQTTHLPRAYTPGNEPPPQEKKPFWLREVDPNRVVAWAVLLTAAAALLGIRFMTIKDLDTRVTTVEKEVGDLSTQQDFTNYLLCDEKRLRDPSSVPQGCLPILIKYHK